MAPCDRQANLQLPLHEWWASMCALTQMEHEHMHSTSICTSGDVHMRAHPPLPQPGFTKLKAWQWAAGQFKVIDLMPDAELLNE